MISKNRLERFSSIGRRSEGTDELNSTTSARRRSLRAYAKATASTGSNRRSVGLISRRITWARTTATRCTTTSSLSAEMERKLIGSQTLKKNMQQENQILEPIGSEERRALEISSRTALRREIFAKGMAILVAHFPKMEIPKEQAELMFEFLQDLAPMEFLRGVKKFCLLHKEIFPNTNLIAHIRHYGLIDEISHPTAWEAWGMVMDEMRIRGGSYGTPNIKNRLVQKAVDIVGWREICMSENVDAIRAHFTKAYESLMEREKRVRLEGYRTLEEGSGGT